MIRFAKSVLCLLAASVAPAALAQNAAWTVSEVSGKVLVRDATGEHAARRGTVVPEGASLSTGPGSRATVVHGKDFMTVNASSRVRIPVVAERRGLFDVMQEWGNALFQIEKKPDPHFSVRTPYLAAVVKGTTFSVTVTERGSSLQVIEGAVETSTADGGAHELIRPGMVAMVAAEDHFRLTVQGQETRTIDSPLRPVTSEVSGAAPVVSATEAPEAAATTTTVVEDQDLESAVNSHADDVVSGSTGEQTIEDPVVAPPANLATLTDGLVAGSLVANLASSDAAELRGKDLGAGSSNGAATGSDNSNAGGNAGGTSSSNNSNAGGNAGGSSSDNSNAGGSAGGSSSSDNSNAGGNAGGSSSDNSNAGGNAGGSSSDNSNAGGNAGGSSSSDNSNAGGNAGGSSSSDNSNAGGNAGGSSSSDNSNAGGNAGGSSSDNSNAGGNAGGSSSDNSNAGGNAGGTSSSDNSNAGGNAGGSSSDNSNAGGNAGGSSSSDNSNAGGNAGGSSSDNSNAGGNAGGTSSSDNSNAGGNAGGSSSDNSNAGGNDKSDRDD